MLFWLPNANRAVQAITHLLPIFINTQALHVIDSFCRGPVRGNCRAMSDKHQETESYSTLLQRRQKPPDPSSKKQHHSK